MIERRSMRRSAAACEVSVTTSSRWRKRFLECSSAQRGKIAAEVIAAFSNASALTAGPGDKNRGEKVLAGILFWLVWKNVGGRAPGVPPPTPGGLPRIGP